MQERRSSRGTGFVQSVGSGGAALPGVLALALALLVGDAADAQTPGLVPSRGHRLYSPRPGFQTHLVDNAGKIVHTWASTFGVGNSVYMLGDGDLMRAIQVGSTSPLASMPGDGGGVQRLAFDGTVRWDFRYDTGTELSHHDIATMPNGNVLMIAWETRTMAETIAAGRDPTRVSGDVYPDHIVEVQRTGPTTGLIVWEWHVWDHLIQDLDATKENFGVVADHPELIDVNFPYGHSGAELNHMNGIDYDPVNDLVILSPRTQDEIWIIDHSTTTAEAAGHSGGTHGRGGDLLWRWGNPRAYKRGTTADQKLFGQHHPRFVPPGHPGAGHVTVFNNDPPSGQSEVNELVLPLDAQGKFVLGAGSTATWGPAAPTWTYTAPNFYSRLMSSAERLPTGNTLICSSLQGRIFEVTPTGAIVWEHTVPPQITAATFHATYSERTAWIDVDTVSAATGGTATFDLVAGSAFEGDSILLFGSFSGTAPGYMHQGFHVMLNPDQYFNYLLSVPYLQYHTGHFGRLGPLGRKTATFSIPSSVAMGFVGTEFNHAFVVFKLKKLRMTDVSNPVPFTIGP
jgi:hypothetical protein